jgi:hypothetical protein
MLYLGPCTFAQGNNNITAWVGYGGWKGTVVTVQMVKFMALIHDNCDYQELDMLCDIAILMTLFNNSESFRNHCKSQFPVLLLHADGLIQFRHT